MNAELLRAQGTAQHIQLEVMSGEALKCNYPWGAMKSEFQAHLVAFKPQIIERLLASNRYKCVYRVTIDDKKITVLSHSDLASITRTVRQKFGTERVGEIEMTKLKLVR